MAKLFHPNSRGSLFRLVVVVGLLALAASLPATSAFAAGAPIRKGLNAAERVTARTTKNSTGSYRADRDRDGLSNWTETRRTKTNPYRFDTDGDGFGDGAEVAAGTDPRDPTSSPAGPPAPSPAPPTPPDEPSPQPPAPPVDTTAPNTTIDSGPSGATTSTSASFGFSSSEGDSSFQCKLDSGSWGSCSSPKAYSSVAVGSHTFSVKATDGSGNTDGSPATRSWTVEAAAPPPDTTAPNPPIASGPSGSTTSTSASFGFSSSEGDSSFQCKLDSGSWGSCSSPKAYSSVALSSHTFSVRAIDGAGNADPSPASRSWTVEAAAPPPDTTAPETTIASGPSGTTTATSASFGFSSSESGSSFQCQLDSGSWGSCSSPKAYSSVAVGTHTFSVKATDGSGNTDGSPATRSWTVEAPAPPPPPPGGGASCTQTLNPGASLSSAISSAASGAVICLNGGSWSFNLSQVSKSSYVTVQPSSGQTASVGYSILNKSKYIRLKGLKFTGGMEMIGTTNHIEILSNEFTGNFGIRANGEGASAGTEVTDVVIDGNNIHNLDYTGSQGTANGYGITAVNGVERFTISNNTIKSPASDYIQSASPVDFTVDHNTFLGPSLLGTHQDHQDLWQIFGGGDNIRFTNNVARNTETHESLLFQEGSFSNVVIENNLFDHDSRGYTCQLYQSSGMVFRNNTVVGSRWGCLFRDYADKSAGSGYQIDHNVFVDTKDDSDVSTEGRAASWGTYDYNVSSDGSASGSHSVRNWNPSWANTVDYTPVGLPFTAGYRP